MSRSLEVLRPLFYSQYTYIAILVLLISVTLFFTRRYWLKILKRQSRAHEYFSLNDFRGDVEAGLTSSNFDLTGNVMDNDKRQGLEENSKRAIQKIMKKKKLGFDDARRVFNEQRMKAMNIDPKTGLPLDPKAVTFG